MKLQKVTLCFFRLDLARLMLYLLSMSKSPKWMNVMMLGVIASVVLGCQEEQDDDLPDTKTELAFPFGILNSQYTDCNFEDVLNYLNRRIEFDDLIQGGVHRLASISIVEYMSGSDGELGTLDDRRFESIEELDSLDYVGDDALEQLVDLAPAICEGPDHPMNNVYLPFIHTKEIPTFEFYTFPHSDDFDMDTFQFYQHWDGGFFPTMEFDEVPVLARKCLQASAVRFQSIMRNPPMSLEELKDESSWRGDFINRNDDFTLSNSDSATERGASIYPETIDDFVWQSMLDRDGGCHLPTYDLVDVAAENCLEFMEESDGDLRGCGASVYSDDAPTPLID